MATGAQHGHAPGNSQAGARRTERSAACCRIGRRAGPSRPGAGTHKHALVSSHEALPQRRQAATHLVRVKLQQQRKHRVQVSAVLHSHAGLWSAAAAGTAPRHASTDQQDSGRECAGVTSGCSWVLHAATVRRTSVMTVSHVCCQFRRALAMAVSCLDSSESWRW